MQRGAVLRHRLRQRVDERLGAAADRASLRAALISHSAPAIDDARRCRAGGSWPRRRPTSSTRSSRLMPADADARQAAEHRQRIGRLARRGWPRRVRVRQRLRPASPARRASTPRSKAMRSMPSLLQPAHQLAEGVAGAASGISPTTISLSMKPTATMASSASSCSALSASASSAACTQRMRRGVELVGAHGGRQAADELVGQRIAGGALTGPLAGGPSARRATGVGGRGAAALPACGRRRPDAARSRAVPRVFEHRRRLGRADRPQRACGGGAQRGGAERRPPFAAVEHVLQRMRRPRGVAAACPAPRAPRCRTARASPR